MNLGVKLLLCRRPLGRPSVSFFKFKEVLSKFLLLLQTNTANLLLLRPEMVQLDCVPQNKPPLNFLLKF